MDVNKSKQLAKQQRHKRQLKLCQISKLVQFDKHFQAILPFTDLNLFQLYNKVVQWIKKEQKVIVKQLIMAAIPLLIHDVPESIQCAQALLNFTILV